MIVSVAMLLISVQTLQVVSAVSTKRSYMDPNPIKYPGPIRELSNRYGVVQDADDVDLPDECRGQDFCLIKPRNYPQEQFNKMFKGYKNVGQPTLVLDSAAGTANRQGDPDEMDGCDSEVTYSPIYVVKTNKGHYRHVVQAEEEDFLQRVRLERCLDTTSPCFTIFTQNDSVKTYCKQKFNTWELLVSDGKNNTEKIKTQLPVCCSCVYKNNFD